MNKLINMSDEKYFAADGVNNSFLKNFDKSPKHAITGIKKTKAMNVGSIGHHYILQPETFFDEYFILPPEIKVKNAKHAIYKDWLEKNNLDSKKDADKIISYQEIAITKSKNNDVIDQIINYNLGEDLGCLGKYYKESQKEVAVFWDELEVQRKAKLDMLWEDEEQFIIFDLKFCQDAVDWKWNLMAMAKSNAYKYYRQAASYIKGTQAVLNKKGRFIFIAVEKERPNAIKCFEMTEGYIDEGERQDQVSLRNYIRWIEFGSPAYAFYGIELIDLPKWMGGE